MAKRLIVPNAVNKSETVQTIVNSTYCSDSALCLGHDIQVGRDVCVCRLGRIGRRCLIPFDPCHNDTCNGHGKCVPIYPHSSWDQEVACLCDSEWFGIRCEKRSARIHVSFARDIPIPSSNIAFIHVVTALHYSTLPVLTYFRRLRQDISNFTFFLENKQTLVSLIFVQLYEHRDQFEYYLVLLCPENTCGELDEINAVINLSGRCRPIQELFNETILAQPELRRVKNYQQPCLEQLDREEKLKCFYDDTLICLCDRTNHTDCFNFKSNSHECTSSTCSGRGICVQNNEVCPTNSVCLCDPCSSGYMCQFSTAGYTLSLDFIVGSHIRSNVASVYHRSSVIQITIAIISLLVVLGTILNLFAIGTFAQRATYNSGCGLYLFFSSLLGLLTMIMLMCKTILLLTNKQSHISCSIVEFLLKWLPASCEWLNACVAIERKVTVTRKTQFSRSKSKRLAKWMITGVIMLVALVCSPELAFHDMLIDDTQDGQHWCVLTLNADRPVLFAVYSALNIFMFLLPVVINFVSSVIIIVGTLRSKKQALSNTSAIEDKKRRKMQFEAIKKQIIKHKHILIAPALLGLLALPRLILAFVFVCAKLDRHPYTSLLGYLVGFLPSMAVLFAFILPSQAYRGKLFVFVKRILPECAKSWLVARRPRS